MVHRTIIHPPSLAYRRDGLAGSMENGKGRDIRAEALIFCFGIGGSLVEFGIFFLKAFNPPC